MVDKCWKKVDKINRNLLSFFFCNSNIMFIINCSYLFKLRKCNKKKDPINHNMDLTFMQIVNTVCWKILNTLSLYGINIEK